MVKPKPALPEIFNHPMPLPDGTVADGVLSPDDHSGRTQALPELFNHPMPLPDGTVADGIKSPNKHP